jgi:hypothetical protein
LALKQAARELSVPQELVEQIYKSYWRFIKETISNLPLKCATDEERKSLTTNFNIPYIGKLYVDDNRINSYKQRLLKYQEYVRSKENQACGLSSTSD